MEIFFLTQGTLRYQFVKVTVLLLFFILLTQKLMPNFVLNNEDSKEEINCFVLMGPLRLLQWKLLGISIPSLNRGFALIYVANTSLSIFLLYCFNVSRIQIFEAQSLLTSVIGVEQSSSLLEQRAKDSSIDHFYCKWDINQSSGFNIK